jgi:predicted amidophosphoribosyltransferase
MKCILCKKEINDNYEICNDCLLELKQSFSYHINDKEVYKEKYDRILARGKVIMEELDGDRYEK